MEEPNRLLECGLWKCAMTSRRVPKLTYQRSRPLWVVDAIVKLGGDPEGLHPASWAYQGRVGGTLLECSSDLRSPDARTSRKQNLEQGRSPSPPKCQWARNFAFKLKGSRDPRHVNEKILSTSKGS